VSPEGIMTILNGVPLEPDPATSPTPAAPAPTAAQIAPVRTLGVVSVLLAVVFAPAGIVVAIIALVRSRRIGYRNVLARAALIFASIVTVVAILAIAAAAVWSIALFAPIVEVCNELGRGIFEVDGVIYRCNI